MTRDQYEVNGLPAPQASKTAVVIGGKARLIEGKGTAGRQRTKAWRADVAQAARDLANHEDPAIRATQFTGPTQLTIQFWMPRPKSRPKKHHGWHTVKPDIDKLVRATMDGLTTGGILRDDSIVCALNVEAIGGTGATGAQITLTDLLVGTVPR